MCCLFILVYVSLFIRRGRGEAGALWPTPVAFGFEAVTVTAAFECSSVRSSTPPAPLLHGQAHQYVFPGKSSQASNPSPF